MSNQATSVNNPQQQPTSGEHCLMRVSGDGPIVTKTDAEAIEKMVGNTYVTEMATRNIKDFKTRSRSNVVPRVAKRIEGEERKTKD
mmetsp:Transcript_34855/g.45891  ORF Transcript_34855/g.45891 Transcript_34855/m.45891 type:complete len:86 (-) Transcript_34855:939-1196(-)